MGLTKEETELAYFKSKYKVGDMINVKINYKYKYVKIKEINSLDNIIVVDKHNREYKVRFRWD